MDKIYRAVFNCPDLDEREVWYVSSRQAAKVMLARHIRTARSSSIDKRYQGTEYTMTVTPVFQGDMDAGYDPRN